MSDPVLNDGGDAETRGSKDPVELSRELLHVARELADDKSALDRTRALALQLRGVDPFAITDDDRRIAFWLNVYNALVKHAMHVEGLSGNLLLKLGLFNRAAYTVGRGRYSLNLIEHGLLRHNRKAPGSFFRTMKPGDARLAAAPKRFDARIHFALNCGARSCPPIRSYDPGKLESQLDLASRSYFEAETTIDRADGSVALPRLLKYYKEDFGTPSDAVRFAAKHLPEPEGPWLAQNADTVSVRFGDYDWSIT